jgi:uncharacterized protein (TIGR02145 family)
MKKTLFFLLSIFAFAKLQAQDYQISFAGTGAANTVETVLVQNLTQGTSLTLNGSDVLHLLGTVGIEQIKSDENNSLQIYPNPVIVIGTVEFEMPTAGHVTIDLFDITGKKAASTQNKLQAGTQTFNVSGLNNGIYTVNVKSDRFSYSGKIISFGTATGNAAVSYVKSVTNSVSTQKQKSNKSLVSMQYTTGDRLLFKAVSGNYATVSTLVPTGNSTVTSNFVDCTDGDGNHYATVTIGTHVWMAENLKTTKYNDGSDISLVTDPTAWTTAGAAYCWYNNDIANKDIYDALYNWFAVDPSSNGGKNPAPAGWHVPSDNEWTTLITFLGESIAGGKMKETGTAHWTNINAGATNESGFTALPGGSRFMDGTFESVGGDGFRWSSTAYDASKVWIRSLRYNYTYTLRYNCPENDGFSVRCVQN